MKFQKFVLILISFAVLLNKNLFFLISDTLRLLTLLFDYGHQSDMYEALHEGIRTIEIDNWLQVIPQLIARIDTPRPLVSRLIHQLLADLGKHHPQALVYR